MSLPIKDSPPIKDTEGQEIIMLKGQAALVTGSTSGIGLGIATSLAEAGANVMLNGFGDAAEGGWTAR